MDKRLTASALIEVLSKLDPDTPIAVHGYMGGTVAPASVEVETLHVAKQDPSFATVSKYLNSPGFKGIKYLDKGPVVVID